MTGITDWGATELSRAIHAREVSCVEVMHAYLDRIHALNPTLNAIVQLRDDETYLAEAAACDAEMAAGGAKGWMHGIPQAIKDTTQVEGLPTTLGSVLLKTNVAASDSITVERVRAAGAIVLGKTNVPELGLGSHTFNAVYGATPNAYDSSRSAGGSSGGAAVALAHRLLPVADGSDFMGSLRNPAGWNNVFGMRPSQGVVPSTPGPDLWISQLGTEGPMARRVDDLIALFGTQAGYDARQPLSVEVKPCARDEPSLDGICVGWLGDLGGHLALETGVLDACLAGLQRMADGGASVEEISLDLDLESIWKAWLVWRGALLGPRVAALLALPGARDTLKAEAIWEYDRFLDITLPDFLNASEVRSSLYKHLAKLLEKYDVLALPVAQVWPFPIEQHWPQSIGDRRMDTYHRWMEVTIYATLAGLPALSVPSGFDATGRWPTGIQLIGRPRGDLALLALARCYEPHINDWLSMACAPSTP